MMQLSLIDIITCPNCKGKPLRLTERESIEGGGDIITGKLFCDECQTIYYIKNGVPQLLPRLEGRAYRKWMRSLKQLKCWRQQIKNTPYYTSGEMEHYRDKLYKLTLDLVGAISGSGPLLDIGCGKGALKRVMNNDVNYIGLEPLITYEESYDFELVQGYGECLPFKNNSIKECFIYQTLDHCISPEMLIQEAHRVLRADGHLNIQQIILQKPTINFSFSLMSNINSVRNYLFKDVGLKSKTHFFSAGDLIDMIYKRFTCIRVYNLGNDHIFIRSHSLNRDQGNE